MAVYIDERSFRTRVLMAETALGIDSSVVYLFPANNPHLSRSITIGLILVVVNVSERKYFVFPIARDGG